MNNYSKKIVNSIHERNELKQFILIIYQVAPILIAYRFLMFLLDSYFNNRFVLQEALLKPILVYSIVFILKNIFYRPRPFIKQKFEPLKHHRADSSFPSKHSAMAVIISLIIYQTNPYLGNYLFTVTLFILTTRYISGVHYISDILVSIFISVIIFLL